MASVKLRSRRFRSGSHGVASTILISSAIEGVNLLVYFLAPTNSWLRRFFLFFDFHLASGGTFINFARRSELERTPKDVRNFVAGSALLLCGGLNIRVLSTTNESTLLVVLGVRARLDESWKWMAIWRLNFEIFMDVRLPKLGEGADSGTVVSVLVKEGDEVKNGQTLIELENEKAVAPIPATVSGKIANVRVKEGDK